MHPTRSPRAAVVLLAGVLLLATAPPVVAAPEQGLRVESNLLQGLVSWLIELFPAKSPIPAQEQLSSAARPGDVPGTAPHSAGDDPTAEPQLGGNPDPDG